MDRSKFKGKYRINSTRLSGYDYSSAGWYHVVICTKDRVCYFGEIRSGIVGLSSLGCIAHQYCTKIPDHFEHALTDTLIVMPNHIHILIGLLPSESENQGSNHVETFHETSLRREKRPEQHGKNSAMAEISPEAGSLSTIIRSYKGAVTRWARGNKHRDFAWQRRFYDRVIRDEHELEETHHYIVNNPTTWQKDRYHSTQ